MPEGTEITFRDFNKSDAGTGVEIQLKSCNSVQM
jgi:hypothetical protein